MSFASKFKREALSYATKTALYEEYGPDYTFQLRGVKFRDESNTRFKSGMMPYLVTFNPHEFKYKNRSNKVVTVPEGEILVRTSADMLDFMRDMVDDSEYEAAVLNETAAFWIEEYENKAQDSTICYSIHFCELDEKGNRIEE